MTALEELMRMLSLVIDGGVMIDITTEDSLLSYIDGFASELELRLDRDNHRSAINDPNYQNVYKACIDEYGDIRIFYEDTTRLMCEAWRDRHESSCTVQTEE